MHSPRSRFRREHSQRYDNESHSNPDEEHRLPAKRWSKGLHSNRRHQVSERIAALHQARENTASVPRRTFHRIRSANAPISAHPEPIQQPHRQKYPVSRCKSAQHGHSRKVQNARNERFFPPKPVGQSSEKQSPDR